MKMPMTEMTDNVIDPETYNYSVYTGKHKLHGEGKYVISKLARDITGLQQGTLFDQEVVFLTDGSFRILLKPVDREVTIENL